MASTHHSYLAGQAIQSDRHVDVYNPYNNEHIAQVTECSAEHTQQAIEKALAD